MATAYDNWLSDDGFNEACAAHDEWISERADELFDQYRKSDAKIAEAVAELLNFGDAESVTDALPDLIVKLTHPNILYRSAAAADFRDAVMAKVLPMLRADADAQAHHEKNAMDEADAADRAESRMRA